MWRKKIKLSLKFSTLKENVLPFNKHVFDLKYSIGSIGQATLPREKDIVLSKAEQANWQNRITGDETGETAGQISWKRGAGAASWRQGEGNIDKNGI